MSENTTVYDPTAAAAEVRRLVISAFANAREISESPEIFASEYLPGAVGFTGSDFFYATGLTPPGYGSGAPTLETFGLSSLVRTGAAREGYGEGYFFLSGRLALRRGILSWADPFDATAAAVRVAELYADKLAAEAAVSTARAERARASVAATRVVREAGGF